MIEFYIPAIGILLIAGGSFVCGYVLGYNKGWRIGYDLCEKGYWR